jgi:hypothetical protein
MYICKYYDPRKWHNFKFDGWWRGDLAAGLRHEYQPKGVVENNPQFSLYVDRPSDLCFHLTQVENGVAIAEPILASLFVVFMGKGAKKSSRVTELNNINVVLDSGEVSRQREIRLYDVLPMGYYTIMIAPWVEGMEGPYCLEVHSNFACECEQIWPPPWGDGPEPEPTDFKSRMLKRAEKFAKKGATVALAKAKEAAKKAEQAVKENTDWVDETAEKEQELLKEKLALDEAERRTKMAENCPWIKMKDKHTGDFYFYNEDTGVSVTDQPEDYIPNANPREKEMNAPKLGKRDLESLDQRTFLLKQEAKKMLEKFIEAGFSDEEIEEVKELHGMVLVLGRSMLDQLCMKPKKKKYQDQLDRSREVFKNAVRECADAVTQRVQKAVEESANSDYIEELRDDLRQWDAMEHAEGLDNCLQYA